MCRNYVVQHVLGLFNPVFTQKICCILSGHYVRLSSMVGGSHIVEKCLKSPWMDYPLDELVNSNKLGRLAADQFGNYVIQTALKVTKVICSILTISFIYLFFISLSLKLLSFCFFSTACKKSNSWKACNETPTTPEHSSVWLWSQCARFDRSEQSCQI